ncbi:hypothetical protein [Vreelandella sp. EE22]
MTLSRLSNHRCLLLFAALLLLGWLALWAVAYSPESCYQSAQRTALNGAGRLICDSRLDMLFLFVEDSLHNWLAVLGWIVPYAIFIWVTIRTLLSQHQRLAAVMFTALTGMLLWGWLIVSLDRSPYHCAFGFGGFGCSNQLGEVGIAAVFLGWLIPLGMLGAVIVAAYKERLIHQVPAPHKVEP